MSKTAILIPVKELSEGKSRLSSILSVEQRQLLVMGILKRVIMASNASIASKVIVVGGGDKIKKQNHQNILEIRQVIQSYSDVGKIYLGGIPMIADDMMTFIKSDIIVFGVGVLLFIIATLWFVFRNLIWIVVPISSCFFSVIIMMGLLGLLGWKVTVISSNFIALMLILTMAMNIHMSTRFLQIKEIYPNKKIIELITLTTNKMFWPILYTALTTIIAFLSFRSGIINSSMKSLLTIVSSFNKIIYSFSEKTIWVNAEL